MATEQEDIEFYKKEISNYEKKIKEKKKNLYLSFRKIFRNKIQKS